MNLPLVTIIGLAMSSRLRPTYAEPVRANLVLCPTHEFIALSHNIETHKDRKLRQLLSSCHQVEPENNKIHRKGEAKDRQKLNPRALVGRSISL